MMPKVGKSITAYYDLDFYEKFPKSDFAQPCDFVYRMWVSWRHS